MTVLEQVCNLEQAKKLKELGLSDRNSTYGYIEIPNNGLGSKSYWQDKKHALVDADIIMYVGNGKYKWSAFNVAELGVMLDIGANFVSVNAARRWQAEYEHPTIDAREKNFGTGTTRYCTWWNTEAQARAAMLEYLIEVKIISVEGVNKRLHHNKN